MDAVLLLTFFRSTAHGAWELVIKVSDGEP